MNNINEDKNKTNTKDNKDNTDENETITYEEYRKLVDINKEKAIDDLVNDITMTPQAKIIRTLEAEYTFLELEQKNIIISNDEMLRLLPNDLDSIESRAINLQYFNKNLSRMKEIKNKISIIAGKNHYIYRKELPKADIIHELII